MLTSLTYSNTFPSTGRSLQGRIRFQSGFGAVTGPNESGKSFIVEMVRFCLFGSAALRGKAEDYKTLKAELEFVIDNTAYRVVRGPSVATLYRDGKKLAVGIKPVNRKVIQLLGFGLEVFDVSCVANQGEIEKLGTMKPAERKRMVDSVIGLSIIDDLTKWANDEALGASRESEAISRLLILPPELTVPDGYRPSAEITAELAGLRVAKSKFDQLQGWLSVKQEAPKKPTCTVDLPAEHLKQFMDVQMEAWALIKSLEDQLAGLPPPVPYTDAQLDQMLEQHDAFDEWSRWQRLYPDPRWSVDEIHGLLQQIEDEESYAELDRVCKAITRSEFHVCPACSHEFPDNPAKVQALREEQAVLTRELGDRERPSSPPACTRAELMTQLELHNRPEAPPQTSSPQVARDQINRWKRAPNRERLTETLVAAREKAAGPDYIKMYELRSFYEKALTDYTTRWQAYQEWQHEYRLKTMEASELAPRLAVLPKLELHLVRAQTYEQQLATYTVQKQQYDAGMEQATELAESAAEWKKVKEALVVLRGLIKQHLIPSLNKVASHLLALMTAGQRQVIEVDEDFDVMVDGQPLGTLSGSGKAVANLALRIGLGQVLTNNVLSLFIGDEIDASMDKDRAENTANTLQYLKNRISQILLVSHKLPAADYYIQMGHQNGDHTTIPV